MIDREAHPGAQLEMKRLPLTEAILLVLDSPARPATAISGALAQHKMDFVELSAASVAPDRDPRLSLGSLGLRPFDEQA